MDHRRLSLDNPAEETCSWLFEHKLYQDWLFSEDERQHNGVLWLKGNPGVGKSVLMKEAFHRASTGEGKSRYRTAAFFFNARGDELEHSALGLFRSLLSQLLPRCPKQLQRLCTMRDERMSHDPWREMELQHIFQSIFSDSSEQKTLVFIDALDECDMESFRRQVSFWYRITESTRNNMKVCISSRHSPNVGTGLSPIITVEGSNSHDIALYVERRLQLGMTTAGPERETLRDNLLAKSSGIFLWVKLMLDDILAKWDDGKGIRFLLKQLEVVPAGLADLYSYMIASLERPLALRFFQWAILAVKPLRLHEWHHIMAFIREPTPSSLREWRSSDNFTETDEQLEKIIKSVSRGLVEVKSIIDEPQGENLDFMSVRAGAGSLDLERGETRVVQVIHESVREFFIRGAGFKRLEYWIESGHIGRGHIDIMNTCLDYINITELDALIRARSMPSSHEKHGSKEVARPETSPGRISTPSAWYPNEAQSHKQAVADETTVSVDILRWLETLSTDSTTFNRIALDSSPCSSSTSSSITGKSQVLEDYPALLSYATTRLFAHARLAQARGANPTHVINRLLHSPSWGRWVALNEEVTPGASLVEYARSHSLTSWVNCIMIDPSVYGKVVTRQNRPVGTIPQLVSERQRQDEGHVTERSPDPAPEANGSPWGTKHRPRATSVASFSSAGSHADSIDEPILLSRSPSPGTKPMDTGARGGTYTCTYFGCTLRFETPALLQRHKREGHRLTQANNGPGAGSVVESQTGPHRCDRTNPSTGKPCNTIFSRPYDLTRHEDTVHNARKQRVRCNLCTEEKTFTRADALTRHYRVFHPDVQPPGRQRRRGA
jgi:hypothetical protein